MIESTNQLNAQQLQTLLDLKSKCKQVDGSAPNLYPHILVQSRTFPVNLFYYEDGELIGFLSIFFFYDDAVEVALLVHPAARRRGIGRELVNTIIPKALSYGVSNFIFSSPSKINDQWLQKAGLTYLNSEYAMERDDLNPLLDYNQTLTYREATIQDMVILCALDEACFPKKGVNYSERFQQMFDDRNYQIIIVMQNNQPIGKAHLRWEHQGVTLSDIAILPALQGKAYGSALIAYCINYALGEGKPYISLDVETHNQRALNLYLRMGFVVQNACDFWSIDLITLEKSTYLKST